MHETSDFLQLRIPATLKRRLTMRASLEGRTVSDIVRRLVADYVSGRIRYRPVLEKAPTALEENETHYEETDDES